jgi:hypothetical protein
MKLGTSRPGTMAPALVAFLVLAGSAALAATQEPVPTASPRAPAVPPVQTGRLGHQGDGTLEERGEPAADETPNVDTVGCDAAMVGGDAVLERAHGIDRAIQAILDRCGRGPATHGLLNALERLRENKAKHAEHGNQGKSGEHGKPPGDPGKSGEDHGKSGQDHGKDADQQDQDDGGFTPPPGGGNDVREGGGSPEGHGQGNR